MASVMLMFPVFLIWLSKVCPQTKQSKNGPISAQLASVSSILGFWKGVSVLFDSDLLLNAPIEFSLTRPQALVRNRVPISMYLCVCLFHFD